MGEPGGIALTVLAVAALGCGEPESLETDLPGGDIERGTEVADYDRPPPDESLDALRHALFSDNPGLGSGAGVCERWSSLDASQRAVYVLLTDRLYLSDTPDERNLLAHVALVYLILGGGADGSECGSSENNRLFLRLDEYAWSLFVDTWNGARDIGDGGGSSWVKTRDLAGPHDPFDMSAETDTGLRCAALIELPASAPPTGQAHFFSPGEARAIERGPGISLAPDSYMLEIDHDFDCTHRSNPLCPGRDFDSDYLDHYGDYDCDWVPRGCEPTSPGCYPSATSTM